MAGLLKKFLKGEVIIAEGTEGKTVYIIRSGRVEVAKQTPKGAVQLATLGPGEVFGEMCMVDERFSKRTAGVRALEDSEIIVLDRDGFESYLEQSSTGVLNLIKRLTHRLRETNDIIARAGMDIRNLPRTVKLSPDDDGEQKNITLDQLQESVDAAVDLNLLPRKFKKGQVLVKEGTEAHSVFLIRSGTVTVSKELEGKPVELDRLCSNELFGEIAMFGGGRRFATVRADEDGEAVVFSRKEMENMLRKAPLELLLVIENLSQKLQRATLRHLDSLRENRRLRKEMEELFARLKSDEQPPLAIPDRETPPGHTTGKTGPD